MLKLFKYEMIQSWRNFMFVFGIYLVLCLFVPMMYKIDTNENIQIIFSMILFFLGMGIAVGVFLTVASNYQKSMFGRSGYLTLTLPVNTHELLITKILASLVWILLSGFVLLTGVILFAFSSTGFNEILQGLPEIFEGVVRLFLENGFDLLSIFFSGFCGVLCFVCILFCALTIAHSCYIRSHRTFFTIVILILYCIITNVFGLKISVSDSFTFTVDNAMWFETTINLVQAIILYWITWYFLEKKLEVQ